MFWVGSLSVFRDFGESVFREGSFKFDFRILGYMCLGIIQEMFSRIDH